MEELRIARLLTEAEIPFQPSVYICCRGLGGTFRFVDFVIHINGGVLYLEIGECNFAICITAYVPRIRCDKERNCR